MEEKEYYNSKEYKKLKELSEIKHLFFAIIIIKTFKTTHI